MAGLENHEASVCTQRRFEGLLELMPGAVDARAVDAAGLGVRDEDIPAALETAGAVRVAGDERARLGDECDVAAVGADAAAERADGHAVPVDADRLRRPGLPVTQVDVAVPELPCVRRDEVLVGVEDDVAAVGAREADVRAVAGGACRRVPVRVDVLQLDRAGRDVVEVDMLVLPAVGGPRDEVRRPRSEDDIAAVGRDGAVEAAVVPSGRQITRRPEQTVAQEDVAADVSARGRPVRVRLEQHVPAVGADSVADAAAVAAKLVAGAVEVHELDSAGLPVLEEDVEGAALRVVERVVRAEVRRLGGEQHVAAVRGDVGRDAAVVRLAAVRPHTRPLGRAVARGVPDREDVQRRVVRSDVVVGLARPALVPCPGELARHARRHLGAELRLEGVRPIDQREVGLGVRRDVARADAGLADEERLVERGALVEAHLQAVVLVAGHRHGWRAVVVVLAQVERGDAVQVLILGALCAALASAERPEADEVILVDRLDQARHIGRERLQDRLGAGAAVAARGRRLDLRLVHQLPGEHGRVVAVAGHHLRDEVSIRDRSGRVGLLVAARVPGLVLVASGAAVRAVAVRPLVTERHDHAHPVRRRDRQRVIEAAPVALPSICRKRLEEPRTDHLRAAADCIERVAERVAGRHRVPAPGRIVRVVDIDAREAVGLPVEEQLGAAASDEPARRRGRPRCAQRHRQERREDERCDQPPTVRHVPSLRTVRSLHAASLPTGRASQRAPARRSSPSRGRKSTIGARIGQRLVNLVRRRRTRFNGCARRGAGAVERGGLENR